MGKMPSVEVYAPMDLLERVEDYADERGISRSKGWRELATVGLEEVDEDAA